MRLALELLEARLLLTHPVMLQVELEPNNTLDTANVIRLDVEAVDHNPEHGRFGSITGDLARNSNHDTVVDRRDVDYFVFSAEPGQKLELLIHGDAVRDRVLPRLLDGNGTLLAEFEYGGDFDGDRAPDIAGVTHFTRTGGRFYIQVGPGSDTNGDGLTHYHLNVHVIPDAQVEHEPNDTREQANTIVLEPVFRCVEVCIATAESTATEPNGPSHGDGTIDDVQIAIFPPPGFELGQRGSISGSLDNRLDTDFFTFTAGPESSLRLALSGEAVVVGVVPLLLDSEGSVISRGKPRDRNGDGVTDVATLNYHTWFGGDFFVQVGPAAAAATGGPGQYTLDVRVKPVSHHEQEPNDLLQQANPIRFEPRFPCREICIATAAEPGSVGMVSEADSSSNRVVGPLIFPPPWERGRNGFIRGDLEKLDGGTDTDFFSFSTKAERKIELLFGGDALGDGAVPVLLDSQGASLATATPHDRDGDGVVDSARLDHFTRIGGDFFVQIGPGAESNGDGSTEYEVHVRIFAEPRIEHEPNDSFETANRIKLREHHEPVCDLPCAVPGGTFLVDVEGDDVDVNVAVTGVTIREPEPTLRGFIDGRVESGEGQPADQDFFFFEIPAEQQLQVILRGPLAEHGGQIRLFDAGHNELASDTNPSDGIALSLRVPVGGTFFASVARDPNVAVDPSASSCPTPAPAGMAEQCRSPFSYRLRVSAEPLPNPIEGRDEDEPNDTREQANPLELRPLRIFAPGIELRGGDVHGIAGGPPHDQDVFRFDIHADEHVNLGVVGLARDRDSCLTSDCVTTIQPLHILTGLWLTVHDSQGNRVVEGSSAVAFDAAAAGTYYAAVSVKPETLGDQLVHYRLGVLAQREFQFTLVPPERGPQHVITLDSGGSFDFVDSNGDQVHVAFLGRGGRASITFTDSDADGADIASVIVEGVRKGGSLSVETAGSAEVGSVEIRGAARAGRNGKGFGNVHIDGNLGSFSSQMNLRAVTVDGILGGVSASGRQIVQIEAAVFDRAMADVARIGVLHVEQEMVDALFQRFLTE